MSTFATVRPLLTRLIELIEEENDALRTHRAVSHSSFADRKNQALRDLMMARRTGPGEELPPEGRSLLTRLSACLAQNARLLKIHIAAVGEVSDIIVAGLRDEQSDGTYERSRRISR